MTAIPQISSITNAFANLFAVIESLIAQARAKAESEAPGSGKAFDDVEAKLQELKGKIDVPSLVAAALKEIGDALRQGAIVVPSFTDLSR